MKLHLGITAFIACLTSCAVPLQPAAPHITRQRVEAFIVKGKTTKIQILEEFGRPSNVTVMSTSIPTTNPDAIPYETMAYTKIYSTFPVEVVSLIVQLDRRGVVIGFIFTGQDSPPGT